MKLTLTVLFVVVVAGMCCAQTAPVLYNQPSPLQMIEHTSHASQQPMATSQSLLHSGAYAVETGERPIWEFGTIPQQPSLGEVARSYRKEHLLAKKAQFVWEKQR